MICLVLKSWQTLVCFSLRSRAIFRACLPTRTNCALRLRFAALRENPNLSSMIPRSIIAIGLETTRHLFQPQNMKYVTGNSYPPQSQANFNREALLQLKKIFRQANFILFSWILRQSCSATLKHFASVRTRSPKLFMLLFYDIQCMAIATSI